MKHAFSLIFIIFFSIPVSAQNYIVATDYWFDNDYSNHVLQSVFPQKQLTLLNSVATDGLSRGLHSINIRFQQSNLFWSQTVSNYFYKTGDSSSLSAAINGYRYWVEGSDSVVLVNLASPVNPLYQVALLNLAWVPKGVNYLYMQFRDELNNWSIPSIDSFYKSGLPVAAFDAVDTLFCTGDSAFFINNSIDGDIYTWHFGDGDSSNAETPTHVYANPGTYDVSLSVVDTVSGTDSTLVIDDFIHIAAAGIADFTFTQNHLTFDFINNSQNSYAFLWDFGDGDTSSLTNPVHTYLHDGSYTVTLTAFDSCGFDTDTQIVLLVLSQAEIIPHSSIDIIQETPTRISLEFHSDMNACYVEMLNMIGQVMHSWEFRNNVAGANRYLYLNDFPAGFYLFRVRSGETVAEKLVYTVQ